MLRKYLTPGELITKGNCTPGDLTPGALLVSIYEEKLEYAPGPFLILETLEFRADRGIVGLYVLNLRTNLRGSIQFHTDSDSMEFNVLKSEGEIKR